MVVGGRASMLERLGKVFYLFIQETFSEYL